VRTYELGKHGPALGAPYHFSAISYFLAGRRTCVAQTVGEFSVWVHDEISVFPPKFLPAIPRAGSFYCIREESRFKAIPHFLCPLPEPPPGAAASMPAPFFSSSVFLLFVLDFFV